LIDNALRNNAIGRSKKVYGDCCPILVAHPRILRNSAVAPPTIAPAIVARKTHLMILIKRTVDSVRCFLTVNLSYRRT
jgi:hypothetical protein